MIVLNNCAVGASGDLNPFLAQELPFLLQRFAHVDVVCYEGVARLTDPCATAALRRPGSAALRAWLRAPVSRDFWREVRHLFRDGKGTPKNLLKLLAFTQRGLKMHLWTETLLNNNGDTNTTLYAFWMSFDGYAAALSKRRHPAARFVVRGHAYDIDIQRNPMNPYLMKRCIAEAADGLYPISEGAREQLMQYMADYAPKLHVLAMGSGGEPLEAIPLPPRDTQGVLQVISCAMLSPIKQVDVLVRALARWDGMPLCWTHVGGGEGEAALRALAEELLDRKENVIYHFAGTISSAQLEALYTAQPFDVFVNTSQKEGVPVSIMEAMRHGIPTIAPRVGGIPELVTEETGFLYAPDRREDGVLEMLNRLAALSTQALRAMREAAANRQNTHFCASALLKKLFP